MKEIKNDLTIVSKNSKEFAEAELKLLKLQALEEASTFASFMFSRFLFVVVSTVAYGILVLSAGIYLNEMLDSPWQGLALAGLGSLVMLLLLYLLRKTVLEYPVQNFVIRKLSKKLGA